MSFTTTRLVGHRVLVQGTDIFGGVGCTRVSSVQWDEIKANTQYSQATEAFDAAVQEFFAPLTEAAEALTKDITPPDDPDSYVVLEEKVEGTPGNRGVLISLDRDSVILRLIEEGKTDRLVWTDGELDVIAALDVPEVTADELDEV